MSSPLARYETFLVNNGSTISSIESTLRSLTWFLPGRFKDAELASETLSTVLNLISLYHDALLARVARTDPRYKPLLPPSSHTRFTGAWAERVSPYKWAAHALEVIRFVQLLLEMAMRRKLSEKAKWRAIVLLEFVKALLRLFLLRLTRRPLLNPPIPERQFDPDALPAPSSLASSPTLAPSSPPSSSPPGTPDHLRNNLVPLPRAHVVIPPPPTKSENPVEEYLLPKALTTSAVRSPLSLIKPFVGPLQWIGELTYELRPLVYAILLANYGRKSSRPLTAMVAMEVICRNLRRLPPASAGLEREEYSRRDRDLLWYLLRGGIWDEYTKPKVEAFVQATSKIPLVSILGFIVKEWIPLIEQYHYYTAM